MKHEFERKNVYFRVDYRYYNVHRFAVRRVYQIVMTQMTAEDIQKFRNNLNHNGGICSSWAGFSDASMTQLKPWTPADKSPRFPHYNVIFCDQIFDSILIAFFFQKFLRP